MTSPDLRSGGAGGGNLPHVKFKLPENWQPRRIETSQEFILYTRPLTEKEQAALRPNAKEKLKTTS
jgi:hypothetical protein